MDAIKSRLEADKKKLSPAQERAMKKEIHRQCSAYWEKHELELMAMILWQLHEQEGWGPKRLKRFFMSFTPTLDSLLHRYEMETDEEKFWLCTRKLKDIGVNLEEWQKEDEKDGIC